MLIAYKRDYKPISENLASGGLHGVSRSNGSTWEVLRKFQKDQLRILAGQNIEAKV